MDFKKAYEDALERAKGIYNENPSSSTAKFVCGQIFPELKESEDERIRKALLNYIKRNSDTPLAFYNNFTPEQYIAYLERQKESNYEWTEDDDVKVKNMCEEGNLKPSERGWLKNLKNRIIKNFQQSAEWSKEDELALRNAILAAEKEWGADSCTADWLKNRIKSFRPAWKPSEEQMKVFLKANPVNLMPEELSVYKSLCSEIQKLM